MILVTVVVLTRGRGAMLDKKHYNSAATTTVSRNRANDGRIRSEVAVNASAEVRFTFDNRRLYCCLNPKTNAAQSVWLGAGGSGLEVEVSRSRA